MNRKIAIPALLIAATLSACSGGGVRGEPPLVSISSLDSDASSLTTRVDIHNPNDVEMELSSITMALKLNEVQLQPSTKAMDLVVHPRGTEEIEIVFRPDEKTRDTLSALETDGGRGLVYAVDGEIRDREGDTEAFEHEGYFYPIPGKPGEFRGTGPQR